MDELRAREEEARHGAGGDWRHGMKHSHTPHASFLSSGPRRDSLLPARAHGEGGGADPLSHPLALPPGACVDVGGSAGTYRFAYSAVEQVLAYVCHIRSAVALHASVPGRAILPSHYAIRCRANVAHRILEILRLTQCYYALLTVNTTSLNNTKSLHQAPDARSPPAL